MLRALDSAPRPEVSIEPLHRQRRSGGRSAKQTNPMLEPILPSLARSVKELKEVESPCMDMLGFAGTLATSLLDDQQGGNDRLEPHLQRPSGVIAMAHQQSGFLQSAAAWGRAPQPAEPAMHGNSAVAAQVREEGEQLRSCRRPPVPRLRLLPSLESCSASQGSQHSQQPANDSGARETTRLPETARTRSSSSGDFLSARGLPTSGASACLMSSRHRTVGGPLVRRPLFHSVASAAAGLKGENSNSNLGKVFWAASELLASYRDVGGGRSIFKRALARQASMMLRVQVGLEGRTKRWVGLNTSPETLPVHPPEPHWSALLCRMKRKLLSR